MLVLRVVPELTNNSLGGNYLDDLRRYERGTWEKFELDKPFDGNEDDMGAIMDWANNLGKDPAVVRHFANIKQGEFDSLVIRFYFSEEDEVLLDYDFKPVTLNGQPIKTAQKIRRKLHLCIHRDYGVVPRFDKNKGGDSKDFRSFFVFPDDGVLGQDRWFVPHILNANVAPGASGPIALFGYVPNGPKSKGHFMALTTVTNAQWNWFVREVGYERDGQLDIRTEADDLPVVSVDWFNAQQFAHTYNCVLPDEHEWEYAARSRHQYTYPWGNSAPTRDICVYYTQEKPASGPEPVYAYPGGASLYGMQHMAGNVWQWTGSRY